MNYFQELLDKINNVDKNTLGMSINNCHARGVFSLVIDAKDFGHLTRIFIAKKKLKPFDVQYHTHRYPIDLTILKGDISHHIATPNKSGSSKMSLFEYKSPLNNGSGLSYKEEINIDCYDYKMAIGSKIHIKETEFHTMSCSKNSIWVVEERGFKTDSSLVLGVPFVLDGLYETPSMFQINDNVQLVRRELKKIIQNYNLI